MKVLYVTNMYPSEDDFYYGIFIKEQIEYYISTYEIESEIYVIQGRKSKFNYLKSIFEISRLVRIGNFDLIHIHFALAGLFLILNPFIKIPTIVTLHGSDIFSYKGNRLIPLISRIVLCRADKIIILNERMGKILKSFQKKLIKIPCGINLQCFEQERSNYSNSAFLIGFPSDKGRAVKNYPLFLRIVHKLIEYGFTIEIIEFKGFSRSRVAESLSRIDCLLMTSLSEGSPQIIKEALASNVPIVSTNVGDLQNLIEGVKNCYIVDSYDVEQFVSFLKLIIQLDPNERRSNGRVKVLELELDQPSIIKKINQVYFDMLRRVC